MASRVQWFQLLPKSVNDPQTVVVQTVQELKVTRRAHDGAPGHGVSVYFDGQTRATRFVNPLHLTTVKRHILESSKNTFSKEPRIQAKSCLSIWTFLNDEDPFLEYFDEVCAPLELLHWKKKGKPQRILLPQKAHDFLRMNAHMEESLLELYTLSFQYYPPARGAREDEHDHFAEKLFYSLHQLKEASESKNDLKLIQASHQVQLTLAMRYGLCRVLSDGYQEDDESMKVEDEAMKVRDEDEEEDIETSIGALHDPDEKGGAASSILGDKHIRSLGTRHVALLNSYGNIITNAGNATIIGGRLPCVVISKDAARCCACWDHDIDSPEDGDFHNDELVKMVANGPCRDGGAWTLHLKFNEAVHIPKDLKGYEGALQWLATTLSKHLARELLKKYPSCPSKDEERKDIFKEACRLSRVYLCRRSGVLLRHITPARDSKDRPHINCFYSWTRGGGADFLEHRRLVTAVQRHARTGDLYAAVRHPITQPVPHYQIMVSETKTSLDISMPPLTANLSELDYDGDKMKIAAVRSQFMRKLVEECMTVPRLMYNALGRRVVNLSGVAPLALTLAQQNGSVTFSPLGLSFSGVSYVHACGTQGTCSCDAKTRLQQDQVLWKGVLETVYDPVYFFDALGAVGLALPGLLSARWSRRSFVEVPFKIRDHHGKMKESRDTNISYDGFYPVPVDFNRESMGRWISEAMALHKDLFPDLKFPCQIEVYLHRARPSALDGLTFQQMRSLIHAFTPKNFCDATAAGEGHLFVPNVPGLVKRGVFCTYDRTPLSPWQRMSRVLLRLSWLKFPRVELGHNALARSIVFCAKRPSHKDVALGLLRAHRDAKNTKVHPPMALPGILQLPNFPEALGDEDGLRDLALHASLLGPAEAELLKRHCFDPCLESNELKSFLQPESDNSLNVELLRRLMERCHVSHLYRFKLVEVSEVYEKLHEDSPFNSPEESRWRYRVSMEAGEMQPEDWADLQQKAASVGRLGLDHWPALRMPPPGEVDDAQQILYTRDWCRFVGAMRRPPRQHMDIEKSLELLGGLCHLYGFYNALLHCIVCFFRT